MILKVNQLLDAWPGISPSLNCSQVLIGGITTRYPLLMDTTLPSGLTNPVAKDRENDCSI